MKTFKILLEEMVNENESIKVKWSLSLKRGGEKEALEDFKKSLTNKKLKIVDLTKEDLNNVAMEIKHFKKFENRNEYFVSISDKTEEGLKLIKLFKEHGGI